MNCLRWKLWMTPNSILHIFRSTLQYICSFVLFCLIVSLVGWVFLFVCFCFVCVFFKVVPNSIYQFVFFPLFITSAQDIWRQVCGNAMSFKQNSSLTMLQILFFIRDRFKKSLPSGFMERDYMKYSTNTSINFILPLCWT